MWQGGGILSWLKSLFTFFALVTEDVPPPCSSVELVSAALNGVYYPPHIYHAHFKVSDYNLLLSSYYNPDQVRGMTLNYDSDVMAFIIAYDGRLEPSTGDWKTDTVNNIEAGLQNCSYDYIDAWEMVGSLPKVSVQVAGHASGLAYFYHPKLIPNPPECWKNKTLYGVSVHREMKENIRFLAVIVFPDLHVPEIIIPPPRNVFNSSDEENQFLNRINHITCN